MRGETFITITCAFVVNLLASMASAKGELTKTALGANYCINRKIDINKHKLRPLSNSVYHKFPITMHLNGNLNDSVAFYSISELFYALLVHCSDGFAFFITSIYS